ncbi:DUF1254 domain-containing protein [Solicola gregarius]|uniref:DUF1254 domain-containing protein n=1 Tax=Solicola gregarius TaxID=2908642 RepID=A0AA46TNN0_9ACTN|nr:DUF1254 domain-containing protein [Solicola gregarius]UYM07703.1 DUF1254 domain-containing protein [Solicola gregarius]
MDDDKRADLAAEAFVYGFALAFDLDEVDRFVRNGVGSVPPSPFNTFGHATRLAGPDDEFVSINNDTLYSIAQVDLSGGPVRLDVPDARGLYYVLQFIDAWTNNFAYVGHRATGTSAGSFVLLPPNADNDEFTDAQVIRFPTDLATIAGRWAVDGDDDLPAVQALQAELTLTPLGDGPTRGLPEPAASVPDDLAFFERLRVRMQAFPPAERDIKYHQRFEPLGLLAPESPYVDPDPTLRAALQAGLERGQAGMEQALKHNRSPRHNGWSLTYHLFDYNLDFFEIGALDEPAWRLDIEPRDRYLERALAARGGLWGNHGYEAAYAMVYVDGDGDQLDGAHSYELRFEQPPPVGAFWSVTMYDATDFYLVANPINRYSVGDRTPGLHLDPDGSMTIRMQSHEPTDPAARANWLPTPAGAFRPILRMYEPDEAVFDGRYELPPITKAG